MMNAFDTHDFLFIGHRGYAGQYPENTLAGFRGADQAGLKMVELDVRLSRDRQLMVIHDDDLERVAGVSRRVGALTCAELQALDVGTWFAPAFSGEGVPTLAQVFDLLPQKLCINVEIKPDEFEPVEFQDTIESQVLAVVDHFQARRRTLVSSFNPHSLRRVRRLDDTQPLAVLSDAERQPDGLALCQEIGASAWNPHYPLVTPEKVADAHRQGFKVFTFTVNTVDAYASVLAAGVDGVFSDDPLALRV
jgi:glycerophosphoryl diester phosphodiesterase